MEPLGAPMATPGESQGVPARLTGPCGLPWAPIGAQGSPQDPKGPLGPRGYIDKLPINRPDGGVLVRGGNPKEENYGE